jgi:hypothetical protein
MQSIYTYSTYRRGPIYVGVIVYAEIVVIVVVVVIKLIVV